MTPPDLIVFELHVGEAVHLASLVGQFAELVAESDLGEDDPAMARLIPDAYPDDPDAAAEFRAMTSGDLLRRRSSDAAEVLAELARMGALPDPDDDRDDDSLVPLRIVLDPDAFGAWLRTLAAVRLVLASRLGIESETDHDPEDPRFLVYEWLGMRLDGLVAASGR